MKRVIGVTILGAALCAVTVGAQQGRQGPHEGRGKAERAVQYLGLNEQQLEQWRALQAQHREDMRPLQEEGRILRQRVQESLEAGEPEILVGEAAKAVYAHRKNVEAARETFDAQLSSVLTPEQQEKFEALKAARGSGREGRQRQHRMRRDGGGAAPVEG